MKEISDLPLPKRILMAALFTFVEHGYDKASMDEVAAVATTTKRTVYAHFGNKETLFRAAIGNAIELFLSELPVLDPHGDPEHELLTFTTQFSELSTWRRAVLLQRTVIAEAERLPDLGKILHQDVIVAAETRLAGFLAARFEAKDVASDGGQEDWAMAMARLLLNMATGPQRFATLMEARTPAPVHPFVGPSGASDDWLRFAVRFFLQGLATSATAKPAP
jgi:AcrR family transcriptional regulator